ncbi:MAG TPA: hypothetical protein VFZ89_17855 [Solirubrobacteraceae bacterium]
MRAVALIAVAALGLQACESSQSKSRKLAKQAVGQAKLTTVSAGATNPDVKAADTTILAGKDGTKAIVVALEDRGGPQAAVPILITAKDKAGKPVFKNDLQGLQTSLQEMASVRPGGSAYWVHDQVVAATLPKSVDVAIGKPKAPAPREIPEIALEGVKYDTDPAGLIATGVVKNRSKITQRNMPIYAVAKKDGKIVAAGRALIDKLDPEPQKRPTIFRIFFVGDPRGADLDVRAVPSTFTGATS